MDITTEPYKDYQHQMYFNHEPENLTALELYEQFRERLPFPVVVTVGNYSDKFHEIFGSEQMFRLSQTNGQKRVIARDHGGRFLTIPLAIPVKFRVVKGYKKVGSVQTITEIIDENTLPIQVQFCPEDEGKESVRVGASVTSLKLIGNMVLTEVYEENYLVANGLNCAVLYHTCMLIPVFLPEVCFARVTSIRGANEQDWTNFNIGLQKASDTFTYDLTIEYREVDILPEDSGLITSDNIYDYIDAKHMACLRKDAATSKGDKKHPKDGGYVTLENPVSAFKNWFSKDKDKDKVKPPKLPKRNTSIKTTPKSPTSTPASSSSYVNPPAKVQSEHKGLEDGSAGSISSLQSEAGEFVTDYCIKDISESLGKLNLGKYEKALRDAQVDGACLLQLGVETLKEDFNMKGYEAKKLMLFAKTGHLPS